MVVEKLRLGYDSHHTVFLFHALLIKLRDSYDVSLAKANVA